MTYASINDTHTQVESWATKVDDEKEAKSQKLTETKGKLATERVKTSELGQVSLRICQGVHIRHIKAYI